jgi:short-subunit dehydrogenase
MNYSIFLGATSDIARNFIKKKISNDNEKFIFVGKNKIKLKKLVKTLNLSSKAICIVANLNNTNNILRLIKIIKKKKYNINFFANFVGSALFKPFHLYNNTQISHSINLNILAYILLVNFLIKKSITNKSKLTILNIGSLAGIRPTHKFTIYSCAKSFIHNLTDHLQSAYSSNKIEFFLVILGQVNTKFLSKSKISVKNFDILNPDYVSSYILNNIRKKKYLIIPGFFNKIRYYLLKFIIPNFVLNLFFSKNYEAFK